MAHSLRAAILISGRGSNMVALVKAAQDETYPVKITCVISNRPEAAGLDKARSYGIETISIDHKAYSTRAAFEQDLHEILTQKQIDLICCAGFMRILSPNFVKKWPRQILNIHPSLLPKYKGLNTHQRVLEAGDTEHGCTVHWVSEELDGGDIVAQSQISVAPDDSAESLADRLLPYELSLYPSAVKRVGLAIFQANARQKQTPTLSSH